MHWEGREVHSSTRILSPKTLMAPVLWAFTPISALPLSPPLFSFLFLQLGSLFTIVMSQAHCDSWAWLPGLCWISQQMRPQNCTSGIFQALILLQWLQPLSLEVLVLCSPIVLLKLSLFLWHHYPWNWKAGHLAHSQNLPHYHWQRPPGDILYYMNMCQYLRYLSLANTGDLFPYCNLWPWHAVLGTTDWPMFPHKVL